MKVTSTKSVDFPKLHWGINAGEERELPAKKEAQDIILAHPAIAVVSTESKVETNKAKKNN